MGLGFTLRMKITANYVLSHRKLKLWLLRCPNLHVHTWQCLIHPNKNVICSSSLYTIVGITSALSQLVNPHCPARCSQSVPAYEHSGGFLDFSFFIFRLRMDLRAYGYLVTYFLRLCKVLGIPRGLCVTTDAKRCRPSRQLAVIAPMTTVAMDVARVPVLVMSCLVPFPSNVQTPVFWLKLFIGTKQ